MQSSAIHQRLYLVLGWADRYSVAQQLLDMLVKEEFSQHYQLLWKQSQS